MHDESREQSIGDRFKEYEACGQVTLPRRMPLIIRVDGKAFHTWTSNLQRPWDSRFMLAMADTALALCEELQGAKLAFVQSDEISVLLTDYASPGTQPWLGKNLNKVVSVSASTATAQFNRAVLDRGITPGRPAYFDSRTFVLPKDEVTNYFIWRQMDATRNSVQSLGQAHFSHKELHQLSCEQVKQKLLEEKGVCWEDEQTVVKRGLCINSSPETRDWWVDWDIPIFTQQRDYIERHVDPPSCSPGDPA